MEQKLYGVFKKGGSIGSYKGFVVENVTKEEAVLRAKQLRKFLTPGEREYYGIRYSVRAMPINK